MLEVIYNLRGWLIFIEDSGGNFNNRKLSDGGLFFEIGFVIN